MLNWPVGCGAFASLMVVVAACGGAKFTTADMTADSGSSGAGTTDGGTGASDGDVPGSDGSSGQGHDGGRTTDGGTGTVDSGGTTGVDGGHPPLAIQCGPNRSCASTDTCCISDVSGVFVYDCRLQCPSPVTGNVSQLKCANAGDCESGHLCCVSRSNNITSSVCAQACAGNEGQLCDPSAKTTECSARMPCSSNNIGDWNLSTFFGTCGGISVP